MIHRPSSNSTAYKTVFITGNFCFVFATLNCAGGLMDSRHPRRTTANRTNAALHSQLRVNGDPVLAHPGFCTGNCPVKSIGLSAPYKAQHSRKLLQDWDIINFRIFIHYMMSLKTFLQAKNRPLHIQNILKNRSWIEHKSFLVYLVRSQKEKSLAFSVASSIYCPSNPIFGMGPFSTSDWAFFCIFLWHVYLFSCCFPKSPLIFNISFPKLPAPLKFEESVQQGLHAIADIPDTSLPRQSLTPQV